MIITQTPYRISFAGGGTDLPAFYRQEYGAVLSVALARHIYVTVHRRFKPNTRVAYSQTETVDHIDDLKHELVREALRLLNLDQPMEITTIGDVPAGTGMGSSSSLTVGLLHALHAHQSRLVCREQLAAEACRIEIDILGKPIGKQDQYAAAYGGINYIRFNPDETVDTEPLPCRSEVLEELERRTLLFYTNQQRDADGILKDQSEGTGQRMEVLRRMRDLASAMRDTLGGQGNLDAFAKLLDEGWQLKRSLGFGITNSLVDDWYDAAKRCGAQGGKLLGAGGGGFLLLVAPADCHEKIRDALGRPQELRFGIDRLGSRIVFVSEYQ